MTDIYRLAYISKTAISGTLQDIKQQLEAILISARKNNHALNISGALLYSGGYFCQVIEGPQDNLETLFETIQMDPRHSEITVLFFQKIEQRGFSEWSMAFAGIEKKMRFDIEGIKRSKDDLNGVLVGHDMVSVLEKLVNKKQSTANS